MTSQEHPSGSGGEHQKTSNPQQQLEALLFGFLERKYVQRADARQKEMGLQYTTAETHDLARELAKFLMENY